MSRNHPSKAERLAALFSRLSALGFTYAESAALRRIQMTLHRWAELECGDGNDYASWCIERDETTGKPYLVTYPHTGKSHRRAVPDREGGALKRLAAIMAAHRELWAYHQGDPRGCQLYVVRRKDVPKLTREEWLARNPVDKTEAAFRRANARQVDSYYTRGVAVAE